MVHLGVHLQSKEASHCEYSILLFIVFFQLVLLDFNARVLSSSGLILAAQTLQPPLHLLHLYDITYSICFINLPSYKVGGVSDKPTLSNFGLSQYSRGVCMLLTQTMLLPRTIASVVEYIALHREGVNWDRKSFPSK